MSSISDIRATAAALSSNSSASAASSAEDGKIGKSAKDFEALLLSNWLQQAEDTFAKVPGGDEDEEDGATAQFTQMSMQSLGASFAASGGIGIAKMIETQLRKTQKNQPDATDSNVDGSNPATQTANFLPTGLNSIGKLPMR